MRSIFISVLCWLVATGASAAGQFEAGRAAWNDGDLDTALALLLPLAERGDREAQYLVGRIDLCGDGMPLDLAAGFRWYLRAAEQGHPDAQYAVGHEYALERVGDGPDPIPEDFVQSYIWFSLAALGYGATTPERRVNALDMRERIGKRLTARDRADAEAQIAAWKPLADYFAREVAVGPGSFVLTADGYDDFAAAMTLKLLREIEPTIGALDPSSRLADLREAR
jgi:hypothetical protein